VGGGMRAEGTAPDYNYFITWGKWLTIVISAIFFLIFLSFFFTFTFTLNSYLPFFFCLIICKTKTGGRELVMARRHISICRHNNKRKTFSFTRYKYDDLLFLLSSFFKLFSLFQGFHVT
jgi:hypothetical protein